MYDSPTFQISNTAKQYITLCFNGMISITELVMKLFRKYEIHVSSIDCNTRTITLSKTADNGDILWLDIGDL